LRVQAPRASMRKRQPSLIARPWWSRPSSINSSIPSTPSSRSSRTYSTFSGTHSNLGKISPATSIESFAASRTDSGGGSLILDDSPLTPAEEQYGRMPPRGTWARGESLISYSPPAGSAQISDMTMLAPLRTLITLCNTA
jgi:hypothetical protein